MSSPGRGAPSAARSAAGAGERRDARGRGILLRGWAAALALAGMALAQAGCASGTERVPAACEKGPSATLHALAAAPGPVRIDGARISSCFARRSSSADIEALSTTLLLSADALAPTARAHPDSPAATQLGYLIGAARRGASRTEGIHYELVRRLEQELVGVDTRSPAFRRGERAGLVRG